MRVFIAGGTGVLGRRIVPLLRDAGHDVVGLARSDASAQRLVALGAEVAARPDVVMNQLTDLAAGDSVRNAELRVVGSRHLADAAAAAGVRRLVAQSIAWAYAPSDGPAGEDVPLDVDAAEPRHTTVEAVRALEAQAARFPEWVVLRNGMLYGPDTWFTLDGAQARQASAGLVPAGRDVTSFVHVDDAARAAVAALAWPSGAVNVCDDVPAASSDWVPAFCEAVGAPRPPLSDDPRPPVARGADNRLLRDPGFDLAWLDWRGEFASLAG